MASLDVQPERICTKALAPKTDALGVGLLSFHLFVGLFIVLGWIVSSQLALAFYLLLLPIVALQWYVNRGSCVLNNFETWLRTGCWRDPETGEDGRFLLMLSSWLLNLQPGRASVDRLSYFVVLVLWLAGFTHYALLVNT